MVISDLLQSVSHRLLPNIEYITEQKKLGICKNSATIQDLKTGCVTTEIQPNCDRFKVTIPYAGIFLRWEVIFNHAHPEIPPDFIFGPEDSNFLPDIENIKSLDNWDHRNPSALFHVLEELLEEYRKYHLSLMEQHSRLQCEYSTIVSYSEGFQFKAEDIEVHVTKKNHVFGQVNFLLKLPIDFSKIPVYLTKNNPGEDSAVLLLSMESPEKGNVKPQLFLSPSVKHVIGPSESLAIPPFPTGGMLIDHVPSVCEVLTSKVKQVISSYEKRRDYINGFLTYYDRCVLEFDGDSFRKISMLMEWHDFFFILAIDLPNTFPTEAPRFVWQSIYHEGDEGKPFFFSDRDCPYSPRWKAGEMVERARMYIADKVKDFQRKSVSEGKLQVN